MSALEKQDIQRLETDQEKADRPEHDSNTACRYIGDNTTVPEQDPAWRAKRRKIYAVDQ